VIGATQESSDFALQEAGPSTPLRFAQDDKPLGESRTKAGSAATVMAMELREAALRMTHFYWYSSRCSCTDEVSSKRLAGLLYVDTNG
jgi:hypothetical protein